MEKTYTYNEMLAYAVGYFEGRTDGVRANNTYENDAQRIQYDKGYDAGVYDYITFDEGKD